MVSLWAHMGAIGCIGLRSTVVPLCCVSEVYVDFKVHCCTTMLCEVDFKVHCCTTMLCE